MNRGRERRRSEGASLNLNDATFLGCQSELR